MTSINDFKIEDAPTAEAFLRNIYQTNLFLTARHLLGYKEITQKTHDSLIQALESKTKRKLIVMPRGTFKSSLASVAYPIWLLLQNPNLRILLDSEIYSNSKNFLREIKAHLENKEVTDLFGVFKSDTWNEGEAIIKQRTKNVKEASLTAGGIGTEKTGQHYDVIIMDDMNSPNNSNSPENCEKVIQHFRYCQSILEPEGILVLIGTRYHERDLIGEVLHNVINQENIEL